MEDLRPGSLLEQDENRQNMLPLQHMWEVGILQKDQERAENLCSKGAQRIFQGDSQLDSLPPGRCAALARATRTVEREIYVRRELA